MNNKRRVLTDEEKLQNIDKKIAAAEKIVADQQQIIADLKGQRNELQTKIMQKQMLPVFEAMKAKGLSYADLIKLMDNENNEAKEDGIDEDDVTTKNENNDHHAIKGSLDDILGN